MKLNFSMDTAASAEQVLAALTDFTEARPDIWPALDQERYEVHELGETWADVTEGSARPETWAREHYDWSVDGVVSWRATESNFCKPGSGVTVQIAELPEGGSHLEIEWDRTASNLRWTLMFLPMRVMGPRMLTKAWQPVFDRLAGTG